MQTQRITFYDIEDDMIPCNDNPKCYPKTPCLVFEVFDEENSARSKIPMLKPIGFIKLNKKQSKEIRSWINKIKSDIQ